MRADHVPHAAAGPDEAVILRPAGAGDHRALERLAGLDGAPVPTGEILLAVVDGEARAAIAIADRRVVADPFRPTAHLVELLVLRCGQLRPPRRGRRGFALNLGRSKASALGLARTPLGECR